MSFLPWCHRLCSVQGNLERWNKIEASILFWILLNATWKSSPSNSYILFYIPLLKPIFFLRILILSWLFLTLLDEWLHLPFSTWGKHKGWRREQYRIESLHLGPFTPRNSQASAQAWVSRCSAGVSQGWDADVFDCSTPLKWALFTDSLSTRLSTVKECSTTPPGTLGNFKNFLAEL